MGEINKKSIEKCCQGLPFSNPNDYRKTLNPGNYDSSHFTLLVIDHDLKEFHHFLFYN